MEERDLKDREKDKVIDDLKKSDTASALQKIKLSSSSSIKGLDRKDQIKKIEDCIFLVQAYNKK